MATKQTLKSLLGGSDSREQVSLDLGTPALSPTVQRAGQYNVAVAPTPKTNSALQLAQALRQTPQVLGQANNIAMDMGAKAASQVAGADLADAMQDKESKGILGFNKAYQYGIAKRHFALNKDKMREQFLNLAGTQPLPTGNSEQERLASVNEFTTRLAEERQKFDQELMDKFGGDAHREDALRALSGALVDDMQNEAASLYTKNLEEQTEMFISADASTMMKEKGVASGLDHAINQYKILGISPKERSTKARGIVTAEVAVLLEQGKLSQAEALLNEASTYNLHGNAKLFGSTEGKKEISKLRSSIKDARNNVEDNLKPLKANVEIHNDTVMSLFLSSASFETKQKGMMNALLAGKVSEADAQEKLDTLFTEGMSPNDMFQAWNTLTSELAVNGSDISQTLLGSIQDDNLRITKEGLFAKPILGITTLEQYNEASTKIKEYRLANPTAILKDIPLGPNISKADTKIIEIFDTHSAAVKWRNDDASQYESYSKEYTALIKNDTSLGIDFAGEFNSILRQEAQGVWDASGRDMNEFNTNIQVKAKKILADVRKEASIQNALNKRVKDMVTSATSRSESIEQARRKDDPLGPDSLRDNVYPLLQLNKMPDNVEDFVPALIDERKRMLDDRDASALIKGSLLIHGFPTLDSYDERTRAKASIGFQDFPLGGEVFQALRDAADGWDIDNPSEEQQKAIQFWRGQGYRSLVEINDILDAQISYYSLGY